MNNLQPARHTIHTPRLELRPFRTGDVPSLFTIQGNRDAMRFTYAAPSLEDCARRLQGYEETRALHGFAPWVAVELSTSHIIGWGGLNLDPFDPGWGTEVSYFFHPECWGRGFASELVLASLQYAFEGLSLPWVGAFAMPSNTGSVRVLEKCGFEFLRYEPRLERNYYRVSRGKPSISS